MAAIKGQGAQLAISTAQASATTITGITAANPVVVTAVNTYANGDIVFLSGIVGPTNLNNRAFVVSAASGSGYTLKGEDGTGNTAWASGGSGFKQTMLAIVGGTNIQGFDGQASEIDVTTLQSQAKEFVLGLQDFGTLSFTLFQLLGDASQAALRKSKTAASTLAYSLTLSDGSVAAFMALVKQYTFDGAKPDGAISNNVVLRLTNAPSYFA
jgi:hypothetical protein